MVRMHIRKAEFNAIMVAFHKHIYSTHNSVLQDTIAYWRQTSQ